MYPAHFLALFPPFPREDEVFVAMSFDARFERRWKQVIDPAIRRVRRNDVALRPVRVDARTVSDSILTEILSGISRCRLVFADVTTIAHVDDRAVRNANVMYEVGLAHAVRLPEEVLMFRADDDPLPFDTSNVRVNRYFPDEKIGESQTLVSDAIVSAFREIDVRRHLAVQKALDSLDHVTWWLLAEASGGDGITHPEIKTMRHVLQNTSRVPAINRLLEIGLLRTTFLKVTPEALAKVGHLPESALLKYKTTEFGEAVFQAGVERFGISHPEVEKLLDSAPTEGHP